MSSLSSLGGGGQHIRRAELSRVPGKARLASEVGFVDQTLGWKSWHFPVLSF